MRLSLAACLAVLVTGCNQTSIDHALQRMKDQPRYDTYHASGVFPNGAVMQTPPAGTVARDEVPDRPRATGRDREGAYLAVIPVPVTDALLDRGRSRFGIFCAVCHGGAGDGQSIVASNMVERPPPSLIRPDLREMAPGMLYEVVAQGFGRMPSYAAQLTVEDRWAVVGYVKRLQMRGRQ